MQCFGSEIDFVLNGLHHVSEYLTISAFPGSLFALLFATNACTLGNLLYRGQKQQEKKDTRFQVFSGCCELFIDLGTTCRILPIACNSDNP